MTDYTVYQVYLYAVPACKVFAPALKVSKLSEKTFDTPEAVSRLKYEFRARYVIMVNYIPRVQFC